MSVNKLLVPVLVIGLMLGTVLVAQANGWWIVSGKEMVDAGNLQSSDDIKGWMSFQQVADGLGIDVAVLYTQLELPADLPPATALKDMESIIPGFEVTTVREVVASYLGEAAAPASGEEPSVETTVETLATAPAASTAQTTPAAENGAPNTTDTPRLDEATATPEVEAGVPVTATALPVADDHTPIGDGTGQGAGDGSGEAATVVAGGLSPADIKGRHTLSEIVEGAGVSLPALLAALALPADTDPGTQVRELVEGGALAEIDAVRAAVTELQEQR